MLDEVETFLLKIGLTPIVLQDQPSIGQTVIEKVECNSDVPAAIILFTPDDLGYPRDSEPKDAKLRARQNVVFELGFFIGKLKRGKIILLHKTNDNFEIPSDLGGVLYVPFDDGEEWKGKVVTDLVAMGFSVDPGKAMRA